MGARWKQICGLAVLAVLALAIVASIFPRVIDAIRRIDGCRHEGMMLCASGLPKPLQLVWPNSSYPVIAFTRPGRMRVDVGRGLHFDWWCVRDDIVILSIAEDPYRHSSAVGNNGFLVFDVGGRHPDSGVPTSVYFESLDDAKWSDFGVDPDELAPALSASCSQCGNTFR
ncbi:MAG: hypothetical protein Tsb0013_07020 [Phycisphaerales bacterium]